jgi:hypothetical protein
MNDNKQFPTIFLRLFFSHLLIVLICLFVFIFVFRWVFAPGVKIFIVRNPLIVVPAVMILLGLAGLIALWTSTTIAIPLESITEALHSGAPLQSLAQAFRNAGTEEASRLIVHLTPYVESYATATPASSDGPAVFIIHTDIAERFTGMNAYAKDVFSSAPDVLSEIDFTSFLQTGGVVTPFENTSQFVLRHSNGRQSLWSETITYEAEGKMSGKKFIGVWI